MREAGRITALALQAMREAVRPGVSTIELDHIAAEVLRKHNAKAGFSGLSAGQSAPVSGDDHVRRSTRNWCTAFPARIVFSKKATSSASTLARSTKGLWVMRRLPMGVGTISARSAAAAGCDRTSALPGIDVARAGNETSDISKTIQKFVESQGFSVVREYTGHGVGRAMHEDPQVPNWWPSGRQRTRGWRSVRLVPGITFALEPMVMHRAARNQSAERSLDGRHAGWHRCVLILSIRLPSHPMVRR